jgi:catechol 2,3-dioxygenase
VSSAGQSTSIDPRTLIGAVRLAVADLDRTGDFYVRSVGLRALHESDGVVRLGSEDGPAIIELVADPDAPRRPPGTTGLFHLAILVPGRRDLAAALKRVGDSGWRFAGASDHLVSEALYLSDPEGNGIEIYRDRPRDEWSYDDGQVRMATVPLDLEGVLGELDGAQPAAPMAAGTRIGHVHLNVADLESTEAFYSGALGFDVTVRDYPGALFMSAGGYHHHVGANTWAGEGAPPPPPGALGLRWFEVVVPSRDELSAIERRLGDAGYGLGEDDGALEVADPSANRVRLSVSE